MSASLIISRECDFCVAFCRYSSKAGSVKKMYLVNKNIVNWIDDIFWKMGFKTETDAEKVIIRIISLKLDYTDYTNYIYCSCCRFAWILELPITCGRTNALISPDRLKLWPISFVQPCVLVDWNTSRPPMLQATRPPPLPPWDRARWSWLTTSEAMLLPLLPAGLDSAMNPIFVIWNNVYNC